MSSQPKFLLRSEMRLGIGSAAVLFFAGLAAASAEDNGPPADKLPLASSIDYIDPLTMPPEPPAKAAAIAEPRPGFPWEGQMEWEDVPAATQKQQQR
jgi:hypothetical protein